ncbi:M23 family metallopeptidase [Herbiconiux sp. KACC 21604]|uniref:M23 family metallopeptidase n=1 Tax=unclassified Herbiconiux TaxID=2618217 RepID=UPI00149245F8|nr:M23 family metallopeptidase [Herbiconiux sp. SALV-R1]QJU53393.1 M23 family metallopeptidase [Herbiconiux sp. SALV-R1]WPO88358.1 M23 family metallopeptidase [Herbiconiux sp. KACC 21604]
MAQGGAVSGTTRAIARVRPVVQYAGLTTIAVGVVLVLVGLVGPETGSAGAVLVAVGVGLAVVTVLLSIAAPAAGGTPLALAAPVRGRWRALNSPSSGVPSHGTHAYGQSYAVDLLYTPEGVEKPEFGSAGGSFLDPSRFPAFGQPVLAPADAVVVRAVDGCRDHRSRSSWPALLWFFAESAVREARGLRGMLGNHLVLRLADGTHVVLAHLRRHSIRVPVGAEVHAGDELAECGNSGNSTEPHLHVQRQDEADPQSAVGLPFTFEPGGIPANGDHLQERP